MSDNLDIERDFYASIAPHYDTFYGDSGYSLKTREDIGFIQWALGEHIPHSTWLYDIACGTGRHLVPLLQMGYHVEGIDLSPAMIAIARAKAAAAGVEVTLHESPMQTLPDLPAADGIICMLTAITHLHSTVELQQAFAGFLRLLKPGGTLVLDTLNFYSLFGRFKPQIVTNHVMEGGFIQRTVDHRIDTVRGIFIHDEYVLTSTEERTFGQRFCTEMRMWSWPELQEQLSAAGFEDPQMFGEAGARIPAAGHANRILAVARKPGAT